MQKKIDDLETKLIFLDDLVEQLNKVIYRQQKQLDDQERKINRLSEQLKSIRESHISGEDEGPPPHY